MLVFEPWLLPLVLAQMFSNTDEFAPFSLLGRLLFVEVPSAFKRK